MQTQRQGFLVEFRPYAQFIGVVRQKLLQIDDFDTVDFIDTVFLPQEESETK